MENHQTKAFEWRCMKIKSYKTIPKFNWHLLLFTEKYENDAVSAYSWFLLWFTSLAIVRSLAPKPSESRSLKTDEKTFIIGQYEKKKQKYLIPNGIYNNWVCTI